MHLDLLRKKLVETSLAWEHAYGNAPAITSVLSELDAALLVGCTVKQYSDLMQGSTVVQKGFDFIFDNKKYQVKACRPSGKPGSFVTKVPKASNYDWDILIWILYNRWYEIEEAWLWDVTAYTEAFDSISRISPAHMRRGTRLN